MNNHVTKLTSFWRLSLGSLPSFSGNVHAASRYVSTTMVINTMMLVQNESG